MANHQNQKKNKHAQHEDSFHNDKSKLLIKTLRLVIRRITAIRIISIQNNHDTNKSNETR